jgi:23S rRNA (cytosine1962-C5)-methyltransferase
MKKIILKHKKEAAVKRFHPWIFSGAIHQMPVRPENGDWVEVFSSEGEWLGAGHFQDASIAVRILSFELIHDRANFWQEKMAKALAYRQSMGLIANNATNCYRLIHAEGDGLPGLIIDIYKDTAVVQCHSIGMCRDLEYISAALVAVLGDTLKAIYNKSSETLPTDYPHDANGYIWGESQPKVVQEYDHQFFVDWETGQKTGFFLDQRENRKLLGNYVKDKKVLNAFCYSGGFSVYALQSGAKQVDSVDISERAMEWTNRNVALNNYAQRHRAYTEDVLKFLKNAEQYDVIVIDPPAFAKSLKKKHNAVQGYKRLNMMAIEKLAPNGILFTFSCSQVVDRQLFEDTVTAAALEVGRKVRIMHYVSQAPDHPVNLFHPESSYLKGLVLSVE